MVVGNESSQCSKGVLNRPRSWTVGFCRNVGHVSGGGRMPGEQTNALSLVAAYPFATQHGFAQQAAEIRNMAIDGFKNKSSVRRGYMLKLLKDNGLLAEFMEKHWSFGKTHGGEAKQRRYNRLW